MTETLPNIEILVEFGWLDAICLIAFRSLRGQGDIAKFYLGRSMKFSRMYNIKKEKKKCSIQVYNCPLHQVRRLLWVGDRPFMDLVYGNRIGLLTRGDLCCLSSLFYKLKVLKSFFRDYSVMRLAKQARLVDLCHAGWLGNMLEKSI